MRRYEELSEIFSEKDNYSQSRELLKEVSCQAKGCDGHSGNFYNGLRYSENRTSHSEHLLFTV